MGRFYRFSYDWDLACTINCEKVKLNFVPQGLMSVTPCTIRHILVFRKFTFATCEVRQMVLFVVSLQHLPVVLGMLFSTTSYCSNWRGAVCNISYLSPIDNDR